MARFIPLWLCLLAGGIGRMDRVGAAWSSDRLGEARSEFSRVDSAAPNLNKFVCDGPCNAITGRQMAWFNLNLRNGMNSLRGHTATATSSGVFLIGGMIDKDCSSSIFHMDAKTHEWTMVETTGDDLSPRTGHVAALSADERTIYIFGGSCRGENFNDLVMLNLDTMAVARADTSGTLPPLVEGRRGVIVGKELVTFGGCNYIPERTCFNTVHSLFLDTLVWVQRSPVGIAPEGRDGHSVFAYDGGFYLFGGRSETDILNDLHMLDTSRWLWSKRGTGDPPPPVQSAGVAVVARTKQAFFFGGCHPEYSAAHPTPPPSRGLPHPAPAIENSTVPAQTASVLSLRADPAKLADPDAPDFARLPELPPAPVASTTRQVAAAPLPVPVAPPAPPMMPPPATPPARTPPKSAPSRTDAPVYVPAPPPTAPAQVSAEHPRKAPILPPPDDDEDMIMPTANSGMVALLQLSDPNPQSLSPMDSTAPPEDPKSTVSGHSEEQERSDPSPPTSLFVAAPPTPGAPSTDDAAASEPPAVAKSTSSLEELQSNIQTGYTTVHNPAPHAALSWAADGGRAPPSAPVPGASVSEAPFRPGADLRMRLPGHSAACNGAVHQLDLDSLEWSVPHTTGAIPAPREGHAMAAVDSHVYVFGGCQGSHCVGDAYMLDTERHCISDCHGHGECIEGVCRCHHNFQGIACETDTRCSENCTKHGRCVDARCECNKGFGGRECTVDLRCPLNCSRPNGECVDARCECESPYHGDGCELSTDCKNDCNNHGICSFGFCYCQQGFEGPDCGLVTPEPAAPADDEVSPSDGEDDAEGDDKKSSHFLYVAADSMCGGDVLFESRNGSIADCRSTCTTSDVCGYMAYYSNNALCRHYGSDGCSEMMDNPGTVLYRRQNPPPAPHPTAAAALAPKEEKVVNLAQSSFSTETHKADGAEANADSDNGAANIPSTSSQTFLYLSCGIVVGTVLGMSSRWLFRREDYHDEYF